MTVEFLTGDDPPGAPDGRPGAGARWSHGIGPWLLAAALVAGATLWTVTRSTATRTDVRPTLPSVSAPPSTACFGMPMCASRPDVPPELVAVAMGYLSPVVRLRVRTVVAQRPIGWQVPFLRRDLTASYGRVTVLVRIERSGSRTEHLAARRPGLASVFLHADNAGFVVRLQCLGPAGACADRQRLLALMGDPRLTQ